MPKLLQARLVAVSAVFCSAIALAVSRVATAAPSSDAPPLPNATRVLTIGSDNSTGAAGVIGGVGQPWLSGHEVLHFRHGLLYRYDATAKTDTVLTQLTRQVKSSHCYLYFLAASPDGQQVVWGRSANNPLFVADVDGRRREQWPSGGGMSEPHWCADGKHWMQFSFGGSPEKLHWTRIQVNSLDDPHVSQAFPLPPPGLNGLDILAAPSADEVIARTPDTVKFEPSKPTHVEKHADGATSFTFVEKATLRKAQTISVWSLRQPQPLHQWTVTLPAQVTEVSVSADGRRVAWLLNNGTMASQSLWVSGLDGGGLREIGAARPSHRRVHGRGADFMSQLQWVPGDKAVSFVYGDALWTVPAA